MKKLSVFFRFVLTFKKCCDIITAWICCIKYKLANLVFLFLFIFKQSEEWIL